MAEQGLILDPVNADLANDRESFLLVVPGHRGQGEAEQVGAAEVTAINAASGWE